MKPELETIKTDKLVDGNFESLRQVLCGNISLDNMSLRLLEGTTQDSDTQNLVIHSGNTRPVGWLPLVGDVYVQEINDKYVDIRSTKPQTNYKILVLFGNSITSAALKAIGGPQYQDTVTVATAQTTQQIQLIEQTLIQFKPIVTKVFSLEMLHAPVSFQAGWQWKALAADSKYFYVLQSNTNGNMDRFVFRLNKITGVCDYLDLAGTSTLMAMSIGPDGYLYVCRERLDLEPSIYQIDLTTFTVNTSYNPGGFNNHCDGAIFIDSTNIFISGHNGTATHSTLLKQPIVGGAITEISLQVALGSNCFATSIMLINGTLWIVMDDSTQTSSQIVSVDPTTMAIINTYTSSSAFEARAAVSVGTTIIAPVRFSNAHQAAGGVVSYASAGVAFDTVGGGFTAFPLGGLPGSPYPNQCIYSDGFVYLTAVDSNHPMGTTIIRFDTTTNEWIYGWIPLTSGDYGNANLNTQMVIDSDGSVLFVKSPASGVYTNFEYATVDFNDYNNVTP